MKIILKYKTEISRLNDSQIQFNSEFETAISKLKDKNSGLHNWIDEELTEIELLHSEVILEFDKVNKHLHSKITYTLNKEPSQDELKLIIKLTTEQLTDGYGEEPWEIKIRNKTIYIGLISLSEKLYPVEIKKVNINFTKKPKELSLLKSIFQKKKCSKKIEMAVKNGDLEYVKNYIDNGENINCQGKWKQNLLMNAISNEKEKIALFLIDNGVDIKSVDDENNSALFNTGYFGLIKVAYVLIEKGALINKKCRRDMTPLMNASNRNHLELVKLLVENGAVINTQCVDGYTALTYTSNPEIVQFLLSKGADIKFKSYQGLNALEQAKNEFKKIKNYGTTDMISNQDKIVEILKKS